MIILDRPYVSELLADTISKNKIPVIKLNEVFIPNESTINLKKVDDLLIELEKGNSPILFNSENGLNILSKYAPNHYLTTVTDILKNKVTFRKTLSRHYTDFFFTEVSLKELEELDPSALPFPIIVKPVIGYSSIGVHRIDKVEEYKETIKQLKFEMEVTSSEYPIEVINNQSFIIEKLIEGDEYAVDVYFTEDGEPVILNLFKRMFRHEKDMSDRIYYTSKQVINESLNKIQEFLRTISSFFALKSAPIHIEIRIDKDQIVPIEVNPLRFAGIGTNELGVHAYGVNACEYFFKQEKPDWENIVNQMDDSIYSFCCAEIDASIDCKQVVSINHEAFKLNFGEILEYRPMNVNESSTFAVIFHKSPDLNENRRLLNLDLNQYITLKEMVFV
ncbi:ATP-grasp domain-containing protein [Lysinibacillus sp. CNPSo 3705]|uniref:ATP-grasp domain-containing protein n=1 Tax=Lysinibacillus sp. CNPSo 3705 TaxID=3028148 RepID=UPI002363E32B|nr:ATP-grasp domain-containing protein [Lysinibacillus sp. CNPSo 3705]MDD1505844.1 ATP-grasp domain-containing protein [Lysinibacillus sp. CNPSo 3705]